MKKLLTTTLLSLMLSTTAVSAKDYSLTLTDPSKPASLEIEMMKGSITIIGYEGKTVEISSSVDALSEVDQQEIEYEYEYQPDKPSKGDRKQRSSAGLKKVTNSAAPIHIEEHENQIEISSQSRNQNVNLTVKIPHKSSISLAVHRGGDIKISDVTGAMELVNNRGAIYAEGVTGPIIAETHRQDIEVSFDALAQDTPSSLTTHRGNVDITVSPAFKAKVEVQTYKGEIFSGIDANFVADKEVKHERKSRGQEITIGGLMAASVNGGGQKLTINTYRGNIYVRKK